MKRSVEVVYSTSNTHAKNTHLQKPQLPTPESKSQACQRPAENAVSSLRLESA